MDSIKPHGIVTNIQHFCYHDGPGLRTTVFLKGCSFKCKWCSNPETISKYIQIAYSNRECIGRKQCGRCIEDPMAASVIKWDDQGKVLVEPEVLKNLPVTFKDVCPYGVFYAYGREMTVEDVLNEVKTDMIFYGNDGGITLSGGEPLLQADFAAELLKEAHQLGITTAIETAGNVDWINFEKVLPHVDTMLHDIKHASETKHIWGTGVSNKRSINNFQKAYEKFKDIQFIARTPVIPGFNDNREDIKAILDILQPFKETNNIQYEILEYHKLGEGKYREIGEEFFQFKGEIDQECITEIKKMMCEFNC